MIAVSFLFSFFFDCVSCLVRVFVGFVCFMFFVVCWLCFLCLGSDW